MIRSNARRGFITPLMAIPLSLAMLAPYAHRSAGSSDQSAAPQQRAEAQVAGNGGTQESNTPVCIVGFSKNLCNGSLTGGLWKRVECQFPIDCTTLVGTGALLKVNMLNNPEICGPGIADTCDEAPDVSGDFQAKLDFRIRLNGPCPVRGCWEGKWNLFDGGPITIPIASGDIEGTLGVGTHRVPPCLTPVGVRCGDECERCYNAQLSPVINPLSWTIHVEGSIRGKVLQGKHAGCQVCVTMQGYFVAPAGADGLPIPPDQIASGWSFCGTADGVLECDCITP